MARPVRKDVDYYPHLVKKGKTLFILQNKYGLEGYGFFYKLLDFLAATPDHHFQITDDSDLLYLSSECLIGDENKTREMIELMVKTGKLDKYLWNEHNVIASADFLESIRDAYKDRKNSCITISEIKQKFNPEREIPENGSSPSPERETEREIPENGNSPSPEREPRKSGNSPKPERKTPKNGNISPNPEREIPKNGKNEGDNPQSKVKKSKVKKSKEGESSDKVKDSSAFHEILTPAFFSLFDSEFPKIDHEKEFQKCYDYYTGRNYAVDNWTSLYRNWLKKDYPKVLKPYKPAPKIRYPAPDEIAPPEVIREEIQRAKEILKGVKTKTPG